MPTVPTSFVPGVNLEPSQTPRQSAPFVQPMQNFAPTLLRQTGGALQDVGVGLMREGQTINDQVRNQMDDAAVKNAETKMLGAIQATLHGPDGYLNQRGDNAVNGYDTAAQAITKAKQDAEGALTNDFQRRIFGPVADRHLNTFGAEMNDHRFQQVATVSAKAATDRVDAHIPFAVNARNGWQQVDADGKASGEFHTHLAVVQQEATHAANLMYGVGPDSDIAKSMVRSAQTEVARGVVSGFLEDHAYKEAKTFFDSWNSNGMIEEKTAEVLGNAIKENSDREFTETTGNDAALKALAAKNAGATRPSFVYPVTGGSITQQFGLPEKDGQPHNGVDIAVPVGTEVKAPGPGTVLKVWNDEQNGGGLSMLVKLDNGYTAGMAHLSAANYKPGDQVTQGQAIALTGNSGWNTRGAHLHYTLTDPDGKKVDPTNVQAATPQQKAANLNDFTDPKDLQAAIDDVRGSVSDPVLQKQTVNYLEGLQRKARVQQDEIDKENYRQVQDAFFANGGDWGKVAQAMPEQWAQLDEREKYLFKKGLPRENDVDAQAAFILSADNQTVSWVQQHRMDFSNETYISYLSRAKEMDDARQTPGSTRVQAVSMDNEQLDSILFNNGLQRLVNPTEKTDPKDKEESIQLRTAIKDQIDASQQQAGKELTRQQKADLMQQTILQRTLPVYAPTGFGSFAHFMFPLGYTDSQKPLASLTPEQQQRAYVMVGDKQVRLASIPTDFRATATAKLRARNITPTEQQIANLWVQASQGAR